MINYLIIGKGLIGSAAARYLSQSTRNVALIGPDEPKNWRKHQGAFASHYDQGRITRTLDSDWVWAQLAQRSIAQYRSIETASQHSFYFPCGSVQVGRIPQSPTDYIAKTAAVGSQLNVSFDTYTADALTQVCPVLRFPNGLTCLWEPTDAGYINPRTLIKAQLQIAQKQGVKIFSERVISIESHKADVVVQTESGQLYHAKKVLLATGAYTHEFVSNHFHFMHIPRTILLAKVSAAEVARLNKMPSIIFYDGLSNHALSGVYALPPIQYPDGHYYIKIGGKQKSPTHLEAAADLLDWFHSAGSQQDADALKEMLFAIVPNLRVESFTQKPCVVTFTPHQRPLIDALEDKIFVAAGGCGAGAKSSVEIGRVAARLMLKSSWDYDIAWAYFREKG